jgi:type II secretion system protein G
MLKKFRKNQKGFTLIELLIVVAIIGILAAIAIPQFASYRQKAYNSAAQSDLKNMKTGLEAYNADNQEYPATLELK